MLNMSVLKDKKNRKKVIIGIAAIGAILLGVLGYAIYSFLNKTTEEKTTGPKLQPGQFTITSDDLDKGSVDINGISYSITLEGNEYYLHFPAESNLNVNTYVHPFFGKMKVENNQITLPDQAIIEGEGSKVIDVVDSRFNLPAFKVFIASTSALGG